MSGRYKSNLTLVVDGDKYDGRKLWHTLVWIPKGEPGHGFTVAALKAMGMPFDGSLDFDDEELRGRTFYAEVGIETYTAKDGKEKTKNIVSKFVTGDKVITKGPEKDEEEPEQLPF